MQVHPETHKQVEPLTLKDGSLWDRFTVEVTVRGVRREVAASAVRDGRFYVHDLAVKFSSGAKVWPGYAIYWTETGVVNNLRPNIDKTGHFQLVGFAADFGGRPVRSQHNAVG